jgi:hypothetical protein
MKKTAAVSLLALCGAHLFCCGIPALLAGLGLLGATIAGTELLPDWLEAALFAFGGLAALISIFMYKRLGFWLVFSAGLIYALSLLMHFSH